MVRCQLQSCYLDQSNDKPFPQGEGWAKQQRIDVLGESFQYQGQLDWAIEDLQELVKI